MNTLEILAIISLIIGIILIIVGIIIFIAQGNVGWAWVVLIIGIILVILGAVGIWWGRREKKKSKKTETRSMSTTNVGSAPVPIEERIEDLRYKGDTAPLRPEVN